MMMSTHYRNPDFSNSWSKKTHYAIIALSFMLIAILSFPTAVHAVSSTSKLAIGTQDTTGKTIYGYYAVLNQTGKIVATGFSTATFTLNNGQTYTVQVDNFGSCYFDHWTDTGSTTSWRTVSISSDTSYTAVMNCGGTGSVELGVVSINFGCSCGIDGYYVVLYQNGNVIATGFTPTKFTLTPGQTYSIQADSYGSCTFYYWQGLNSQHITANPYTFTAPSSSDGIGAVYQCNTPAEVTVRSADQNGNLIYGYYTTLYDQNGNFLKAGFTTVTFSPLTTGAQYTVQVADYGSCSFSHWMDSGSTNRQRTYTGGSEPVLTAIYNCG
jgi:hypothetical protein